MHDFDIKTPVQSETKQKIRKIVEILLATFVALGSKLTLTVMTIMIVSNGWHTWMILPGLVAISTFASSLYYMYMVIAPNIIDKLKGIIK